MSYRPHIGDDVVIDGMFKPSPDGNELTVRIVPDRRGTVSGFQHTPCGAVYHVEDTASGEQLWTWAKALRPFVVGRDQ